MTNCNFTFTDKRGFTLPEVAVAATIMAILVPVLAMLFMAANRGFTGFEAANSLKTANQNTVNRIYLRLGRCKRLFQNTTADATYLSAVSLGGCPSRLSGSYLPVVEVNGSLAPGSTTFHPASAGNSLMLTYNDSTAEMKNVNFGGGSTGTARVDIYKFAYYYLTPDNAPEITGRKTYRVVEWQSIQFADCSQITNISNATKKSSVVLALVSSGVTSCWYTSEANAAVAFSTLTSVGGVGTVLSPTSRYIAKKESRILTSLNTGIMGGGYKYGVSPNTSGWGVSTPKQVPLFAAASGVLPAGFETAIVGPSAARKVLVRSVLVAKGTMNSIVADEQVIVGAARDIW